MTSDAPIEVLVVDDDELVRRMLVRVLERRGFVTHAAADGTSALAMLQELDVDIVLLDQGLPDITGTELLVTLRSSPATATLPVILVTGQADIGARVGGLQAGADDYLVKPVNMDELVARVHAQIRGRDAWRSQVQDKLHERAQLAGALAALEASDDLEVAATSLVGVLRRLPDVRRVVVVAFSGDNESHVIAATDLVDGPHVVYPPHLDQIEMAEVRREVGRGAVMLSRVMAQTALGGVDGDVIALGVEVGGRVMATVLIETLRSPSGEVTGSHLEVLSAAIDFSPLVERVLQPALESAHGGVSSKSAIRSVIERVQFHPVFQPIVELATGRVRGFEALTRFADGVPPDRRFAEAAHAGLGKELEVAALTAALEHAARLPASSYVSVNVSASVLLQQDLGPLLDTAAGRPLVLELTEHERIDDYTAVRTEFERLGRGLRLSVDDAGSGWASMRHVFSLRPDFVKLDRVWVSRIHQDRARQALLLGMALFVLELGGVMVAEGIETNRELATLRSLGIDFGQGFLLGRPMPVEMAAQIDPTVDVMAGGAAVEERPAG